MTRNHHKTIRPQTVKYTPDNLSLFPASLLPFRDECRRLAATLPTGDVLMVVPAKYGRLRGVRRTLSPAPCGRGRHSTAVRAERIIHGPSRAIHPRFAEDGGPILFFTPEPCHTA